MKALNLLKAISVGLVLTSSLVQAASHREAATICESMRFDSSKNNCFAYVSSVKSEYFDDSAIQVCESMSFDSEKEACVVNITSKMYESYEIRNCMGQSFDSNKNACLKAGGEVVRHRPMPPQRPQRPEYPDNNDYIRGQTVSWVDMGVFVAPKGVAEPVELNLDSRRGTVELRLATGRASVRITRAYAITASGQQIELENLKGSLGQRAQRVLRLDSRHAIRLQKLVLEITSTQLIGSRGQLSVAVGMTR